MGEIACIEKGTYLSFKEQLCSIVTNCAEKTIGIWGAGVRGIVVGIVLEEMGILEYTYIDGDSEKQGRDINGHSIISYEEAKTKEVYFILSMEYQDEVVKILLEEGYTEQQDFYGLISSEDERLLFELKNDVHAKRLVLGASVLDNVPIEESDEPNLSEYIKKEMKDVKVLGTSNLSMEMMFFLIQLELYQNSDCKNILILIDFKEFTTYYSLLPRVQKPKLLLRLKKYGEYLESEELVNHISTIYGKRVLQSEKYEIENKYSPDRLERDHDKRLRKYLSLSVSDDFSAECEEMKYLSKILEFAKCRGVNVTAMIQPMNKELCCELLGEEFQCAYSKKIDIINRFMRKYDAGFIDAGDLLRRDSFVSNNTPNDAIRKYGRQMFSRYICNELMNK